MDKELWNRKEWSTFDQICNSLVQGYPIPGILVMPGQEAKMQGLALGFVHTVRGYQQQSLCPPCTWVQGPAIELARVVHAGLWSISEGVTALGGR